MAVLRVQRRAFGYRPRRQRPVWLSELRWLVIWSLTAAAGLLAFGLMGR